MVARCLVPSLARCCPRPAQRRGGRPFASCSRFSARLMIFPGHVRGLASEPRTKMAGASAKRPTRTRRYISYGAGAGLGSLTEAAVFYGLREVNFHLSYPQRAPERGRFTHRPCLSTPSPSPACTRPLTRCTLAHTHAHQYVSNSPRGGQSVPATSPPSLGPPAPAETHRTTSPRSWRSKPPGPRAGSSRASSG